MESSNLCQAALQSVQNHLKEKHNLIIEQVTKNDVSKSYSDYPDGRPDEYIFGIRGHQVLNFLNSPQLMKNLASQIIRNCETVSLVKFGSFRSDDTFAIGLMPDGSLKFFEYLEPGRRVPRNLVWGQY